ncbi:MAG: hypothetical protein V3S68_03515, partial [Dehalococcoidia bacterium]
MAGQLLQYMDRPDDGGDAIHEIGKGWVESADKRLEQNKWLQESEYGRKLFELNPFSLRGAVGEAGEMVAPSIGLPLAGAGIGSLFGPVGTFVGGIIGFGLSLPLYFGAQAQDTTERAYKKFLEDGMDELTAMNKARAVGLKTGAVEGLGELAADFMSLRLMRLLPGKTKKEILKAVTKGLRSPKKMLGALSQIEITEIGTELAQNWSQMKIEAGAGVGPEPTVEDLKRVILPTAILGLITFGGAETVGGMRRRQIQNVLADPEADPKKRAAAVRTVAGEVAKFDKDLAKRFTEDAMGNILAGQPVVMVDEVYDREEQEPESPQQAPVDEGSQDGNQPAWQGGDQVGREEEGRNIRGEPGYRQPAQPVEKSPELLQSELQAKEGIIQYWNKQLATGNVQESTRERIEQRIAEAEAAVENLRQQLGQQAQAAPEVDADAVMDQMGELEANINFWEQEIENGMVQEGRVPALLQRIEDMKAKMQELAQTLPSPQQEQPQQAEPETPIPEPLETIEAQMDAFMDGRKPGVLLRDGDPLPPAIPEDAYVYVFSEEEPSNGVLTDPGAEIQQIPTGASVLIFRDMSMLEALEAGNLGEALGYGIGQKPPDADATVTARDEEGRVVQDVNTDGRPEVEEAAGQAAGPGGTVEVRTPEEAIDERIRKS